MIPHHSWTEDSALNRSWFKPQLTAAELDEKNRRAWIARGTQLLIRIGEQWLRQDPIDPRLALQFVAICERLACSCNAPIGGHRYCAVHDRTS